jgi:type IV secretion system protein VirB5
MKKLLIVILFSIPLLFNQQVKATGIPVVDIAGILQMVVDGFARAKEFSQQIGEAKARLNEMKDSADHYKDMVDGHFDFEALLNDPTLNKHLALDDWKDIYNDTSDLANLRGEFGMYSDDPAVQAKYDRELKQYSAQSRFYDISTNRNKNLQNLLTQFQTAINPAAKADLANSISYESAQIKNDAQMMESMTLMMQQKQMLESRKSERASRENWMETGIDRPVYTPPNT